MEKTKLTWFDTEYCGRADITLQPVLANGTLYYTLFDNHGYNMVFTAIWQVFEYLQGNSARFEFVCESESELIKYLESR